MSKIYDTKAAVEYLAERGYRTTKGTLEVKRCHRRGPAFIKINNRPFYKKSALDDFLEGEPVRTIDSEA
jgi:hypothetical protein